MKKIMFLFQILMLSTVAQQNTKIKRSVTATSNIDAQSDSYKIRGTFGQNVVGLSSGQQLKYLQATGDGSLAGRLWKQMRS